VAQWHLLAELAENFWIVALSSHNLDINAGKNEIIGTFGFMQRFRKGCEG